MARSFFRLILIMGIGLTVACSRREAFDSSLSDAILFDVGPPKVAEIAKIQFYLLENRGSWPTLDDLSKMGVSHESSEAGEITEWVKTMRSHSDGRSSAQPRRVHAMLVSMKDGRIAFFQIATFDDVSYIVPFPARDEYGTHGYYTKALYELLRLKNLV